MRPDPLTHPFAMSRLRDLRGPRLYLIFAVTLMVVLGVASITPAFPAVMRRFDVSQEQVGLLITAFTIPGVVLTLVFGVLADRYGRRSILVPSLLLFCGAGVACGFAPSFGWLLALRAVEGVGAAALGSLNITIIGDLFSNEERGTVMGYNSSVLSVGAASYPAIGGALAMLGWRYPFFLPALAIPVAVLAMRYAPAGRPDDRTTLRNYLARTLRVARQPPILALFGISLLTFILLYGALLNYVPLLMSQRFDASPVSIGVILSTSSFASAIAASQLGRLSRRFAHFTLIRTAFFFYAGALVLVPFWPRWELIALSSLLFGTAMGLNLPSLFTLLTDAVPAESRGAIVATNGMTLRLGQTIGPLLASGISMLYGLDAVFFSAAGFAVAILVVLWVAQLRSDEALSSPSR